MIGCGVNITNKEGFTPLDLAKFYSLSELEDFLLQHGKAVSSNYLWLTELIHTQTNIQHEVYRIMLV